MSKLKSFIRWKENEGTAGMTTARPFIHDPLYIGFQSFKKIFSNNIAVVGIVCCIDESYSRVEHTHIAIIILKNIVPYGIVNEGAGGCHTGRPFVFFPPDERL